MYRLIRPLLFRFDAETIHHKVMALAAFFLTSGPIRALFRRWCRVEDKRLEQTLWGLEFANPVGLAAGFDKNASYFNALDALGFGFIEIGTVTGEGQVGNARPRMFRLPADQGLLNRMGFNNDGSDAVARRLNGTRVIHPLLGVNIGKTKIVPLDEASADYEKSFRALYAHAKYVVVNVSSPNTPGLRELQERGPLLELMRRLRELNDDLARERGEAARPLLLKIAPDITDALLDDILNVIDEANVDGIIATNTTIERDKLKTPGQDELGAGGVSGAPVRKRSLEVIEAIYRKTDGSLPIIGVGGIYTWEDALETIEAGANLVQVWTGFVYEGPMMIRKINRGLVQACKQRGVENISQLRGQKVSS